MHREQIRQALEAARSISHHHEFVIAGSLSVLGLLDQPPVTMSMSIDIDFYPLRDPGRASDIAMALGEGSDFHQRHGFYLDPISPLLPTLPEKWEDRMVRHDLGGVTAYFLDVHDTAVSKYARGAENDFRWLQSGYDANLLNIDTITARMERATEFLDGQEKRSALSRLRAHSTAMAPTGRLDYELLAFLQERGLMDQLLPLDMEDGLSSGEIVWASDCFAVQAVEGGVLVHHPEVWGSRPAVGTVATIGYRDGQLVDPSRSASSSAPDLGF